MQRPVATAIPDRCAGSGRTPSRAGQGRARLHHWSDRSIAAKALAFQVPVALASNQACRFRVPLKVHHAAR